MSKLRADSFERLAHTSTQLTLIEVTLGAVVHAFMIPLGGHVLSLNQGVFLIRSLSFTSTRSEQVHFPIYVSSVVSILKSLSPAGQKLGPMLAISVQGFLFSFGILLFGAGLLGQTLGMVLLSLWSFLQPVLTLMLFFGRDLISASDFYLGHLQESLGSRFLLAFVLGGVFVKVFLACIIPWFLRSRSPEEMDAWAERLSERARIHFRAAPVSASTHGQAFWSALRDLFKPFFLISFLLMAIFFWFAESSQARLIWLALRPVAVAFLFFYLSRSPWMKRIGHTLAERGPVSQILSRTQKSLFAAYDKSASRGGAISTAETEGGGNEGSLIEVSGKS